MKITDINKICFLDTDVKVLEVFPQSWARYRSFNLYEESERPSCALFFICTDITVTFFPKEAPSITAGKGDAVYIPKGLCYYCVSSGESFGIDTYTVNFMLYSDGDEVGLGNCITTLSNRTDEMFKLYAVKLSEAVHTMGGRNIVKIKAAFYSLLECIAGSAAPDTAYYPIRAGVIALSDEWNKNEKIEKYADMCGVSAAYFYKCFHKWSGKSPVQYRNQLRLSNAESMLKNTDMSVSEIAHIIGYDDRLYFSRIFTKHYGISPKKFRHIENSDKMK